jgi:hypothetical protein
MHYELEVYLFIAETVHIINDNKAPKKTPISTSTVLMLRPIKMVKKKIYLPLFFHSLLIRRSLIIVQASITKMW